MQTDYTNEDMATLLLLQCNVVTVCATEEWQSTAATPSADRICEPITECFENEVEQSAPTATSDRVCVPLEAEPEPEPAEARTRTQFETRCVMSQYVPPVSNPWTVIGGCFAGQTMAAGCNVPNLVSSSAYAMNLLTGITSVQSCGSICFGNPVRSFLPSFIRSYLIHRWR